MQLTPNRARPISRTLRQQQPAYFHMPMFASALQRPVAPPTQDHRPLRRSLQTPSADYFEVSSSHMSPALWQLLERA